MKQTVTPYPHTPLRQHQTGLDPYPHTPQTVTCQIQKREGRPPPHDHTSRARVLPHSLSCRYAPHGLATVGTAEPKVAGVVSSSSGVRMDESRRVHHLHRLRDFKSETSGLDRVVTSAGHHCLFLPKYHCELNWIERYWGAGKKYARRHCGYTLSALRVCVPIALSQTREELPEELHDHVLLPVSPLFKQRRWARVSWRYAAEYRKGEFGHAVVQAVAAQSSSRHRDTSRMRQSEAAMEALAFAS